MLIIFHLKLNKSKQVKIIQTSSKGFPTRNSQGFCTDKSEVCPTRWFQGFATYIERSYHLIVILLLTLWLVESIKVQRVQTSSEGGPTRNNQWFASDESEGCPKRWFQGFASDIEGSLHFFVMIHQV